MAKKKDVIALEFGADQKGRRKPKQKKVTIEVRLDDDIAAELEGTGYYTFGRLTNDDKMRRLAPLIWKQLERVLERWQHRPGGSLNPDD